MGYLSLSGDDRLNRLLTIEEFDSLENQCREFIELENWVPDDVISQFGVPSLRWGTNDSYPCTLLYLCEADQSRYIHFDFWAEWFKNEKGVQVAGKYGPQPLLRNIRVPAATFPDEFVFSKFGESLKKVQK